MRNRFPPGQGLNIFAQGIANSPMLTEMELRAQVKQVETEMSEIGGRVRRIDEILNQALTARPDRGWKPTVDEYLSWLDRVEALGLAFVNANIVTQRLRLVYQDPPRGHGSVPDPSSRMREVKSLLETVRHAEQSDLLLLRARRHSILSDIQRLSKVRKPVTDRSSRGSRDTLTIGWLPLAVLLLALLCAGVLLASFQPEVAHFVRSHLGLQDEPRAPTP
jgi:hypothetical protein